MKHEIGVGLCAVMTLFCLSGSLIGFLRLGWLHSNTNERRIAIIYIIVCSFVDSIYVNKLQFPVEAIHGDLGIST